VFSHSRADLFVLEPQRLLQSGTKALAGEGSHVEQTKILIEAVFGIESVAADGSEIMGRQRANPPDQFRIDARWIGQHGGEFHIRKAADVRCASPARPGT